MMTDTTDMPSPTEGAKADSAAVAPLLEKIEDQHSKGPTSADQRRCPRHSFEDQVRICISDAQAKACGPMIDAIGQNISLWGVCVDSPKSFPVGSYVLVDVQFPHHENHRRVRMLAEVRHVKANEQQAWTIGCVFRETVSAAVDG